MSRKAVSAQEKQNRLLRHLHENPEPFLLKELEKIGVKQYGIVEKTVKENLEALASDGLINMEKIGISTYFYQFPSQQSHKLKIETSKFEAELKGTTEKLELVRGDIKERKDALVQTDEMKELMAELAKEEADHQSLTKDLDQFSKLDSVSATILQSEKKLYESGSNRWTENIQVLQSWCRDKFGMGGQVFAAQFGIPEDLEVEF